MNEKIDEWVRGYALPTFLVGGTLVLVLNVVAHATTRLMKPDPIPRNAIIEIVTSPLPRDRLEFLGPYACEHVQYGFTDKLEDQLDSELVEKGKAFMDELRAKRYLPAPNSVQRLSGLNVGLGYDLGINDGLNKWILTYRTANAPRPFLPGFTLIEHGTNQTARDRFPDRTTKEEEMNYFVMNPYGRIEYIVTLNPGSYENCLVFRPQQQMFRVWLQGGPWEDLVFSGAQKQVARKLEEIARNPNPGVLRDIAGSEKSL